MDAVVRQTTFQYMKTDLQTNYDIILKTDIGMRYNEGSFLRKGETQWFVVMEVPRLPLISSPGAVVLRFHCISLSDKDTEKLEYVKKFLIDSELNEFLRKSYWFFAL